MGLRSVCGLLLFSAFVTMQCTAAECVTTGPGIQETIQYLEREMQGARIETGQIENNLLLVNDGASFATIRYDSDGTVTAVQQPAHLLWVQFMSMDCSQYYTKQESGSIWIGVLCKNERGNCGHHRTEIVRPNYTLKHDGYANYESVSNFGFSFHSADEVKAQNLSRALSHLIYLLQQEYLRLHAPDPNDPFAKPN